MPSKYPLFLNPYEQLPDRKLLQIGVAAYILACLQVYLLSYHTNGLYHVSPAESVTWYTGFVNLGINLLILTVVLTVYAKLVNRKSRLQDIFSVVAISQIPNYLFATLTMNPEMKRISLHLLEAVQAGDMTMQSIESKDTFFLIAIGILVMILLIYSFYLLVVGMKTAIHAKNRLHAFVIILLTLALHTLLQFTYPYIS